MAPDNVLLIRHAENLMNIFMKPGSTEMVGMILIC